MTGVAGKAADGGNSGAAAMAAGSGAGGRGTAGAAAGAGTSGGADGETGRLAGMTAAHNAVRARIMSPKPEPALPPVSWSPDVARTAQAYADKLATDCSFAHSMAPGLGENLAYYEGIMSKAEDVVEGWAAEEECYTFGPITRQNTDCDLACAMNEKNSNGCGHYTQVVWRGTTEVGCGVAVCSGSRHREVWVCNYRAPGNFVGMNPY
jgi:pathogenesis-related protein 1